MRKLTVILLLAVMGCNTPAALQRKEDKIFNAATASRERLQRLEPIVRGLWPCANDTVFNYRPGRVDSIAYPVLFDTTDRTAIRDSVLAADLPGYEKQCNEAIKAAYDKGVKFAAEQFAKIKIPKYAPDTIGGYIVDRHLVKSMADTIMVREKTIEFYKGAAAQWKKAAEESAAANGKILLFGGLAVVLLAVALGLAIAFIFKRKTPIV